MLTLAMLLGGVGQAEEVRFSVVEPSGVARQGWPVTSGIPLAQGALAAPESTALFSSDGRELPLQTEALSRWPDGSIRWLLLDFQADLPAGAERPFVLRYGPAVQRTAFERSLRVTRAARTVEMDTGRLRLLCSPQAFRVLDAVWLDRDRDGSYGDTERLTAARNAGVQLTTPDGRQFRADQAAARVTVEQAGPLRACIRIAGRHADQHGEMFSYIVRIHAYAGQPFVKLCYTFVNDNQRVLMSPIDSLNLAFTVADSTGLHGLLDGKAGGSDRLFQVDDRQYEVNGRLSGRRAANWAAIGNQRGGMAVGVRDFWQNWPKSLEIRGDQLLVGICPSFAEGRYDGHPIKDEAKLYYYLRGGDYSYKVGVSRTHEIWATFLEGRPDPVRLSHFFQCIDRPLLAQPSADYIDSTRAAGRLPPAGGSAAWARYDAWLDGLFQLHLQDQQRVREYGMLNFGDWFNIHWDSWGNLEYDTARCFFSQYLRSGDRRYFDRAAQAARHFLDVDVVHAVSDQLRAFPGSSRMKPGHVWLHQVGHTGGYYGRYVDGKYHDEAPLIMKGPYQLGMYNWGHQWVGGVFDYYLLTGDRRALEVARLTADTIAADCPTRYSDHIRDLGWPLNLVLAAYEATGDRRYLDAATRQWKLLEQHFDPQLGFQVMLAYGHCSASDTANRCRGQNAYMLGLTLSGLARYHRLTGDPAALRGLTAGIDQLIRECWSEQHKSFYLTSCRHNRTSPPPAKCSVTALASEAFAYESALTGNAEHLRIFREAFETLVNAGIAAVVRGDPQGQTGYASMMFHFTPHALAALEETSP